MKYRKKAAILLSGCILAASLTGCGETATTISVQSVSMICGFTGLTQSQFFSGLVCNGNEESISKDSDRKVASVAVKVGDYVEEGQVLFTYDAESAKNSLEKAELELEEMQNSLAAKEKEKEELEADKEKAASSEQLDYTLKIQEMDTDIREANYNIALKEKEIQKLEDSTKDLDVKAPFAGMIVTAGTADSSSSSTDYDSDDYSYDYSYDSDSSDSSTFIKIVETNNYRIKGTFNETNVNDLYTGMEMIIYSRVDETETWRGTISEINLKSTESSSSDEYSYYSYGSSDEMTTSSKYSFYISLESLDGLMIGQHVYMAEYQGEDAGDEEIRLDSSFINGEEGNYWIWAEAADGTLEKRSVTAGDYDEYDDTWLITDGLTAEDYICPNSSDCEEGLTCIENNNSAFGSGEDTDDYETGEYGDDEYLDEEYLDEEYLDEEYLDDENYDEEYYDDEFVDEEFVDEEFEEEYY